MEELVESPSVSQSAIVLPEGRNTSSPVAFQPQCSGNMFSRDTRESPDRSDSGAEESLVNPPPPAELGEDECAVLRGDAIGNTAYTHRWVLNTLLVITQALPVYLTPEVETNAESTGVSHDDMEAKNMDTEDTAGRVKVKGNANASDEESPTVLELAEDVENAACQLWDMTVEPDVVHHLLNIGAVDILQLATDIITLSRAPRLTEVVVGVVANLCCQSEGCKKIVNHQALLNACLALPQMTDDVPTLTEGFRFLRLLLWHMSNRLPMSFRVKCPMIMALKGHDALKMALVFILKNSLSETLLSSVVQFLEILLYLWLPDDQCYMAAHYADSGLVEGVVEVMRHFLKQTEKSGGQELPKEVHKGILILYSFMGIHASNLISSFDQYESLLEPILLCYVEHIAKVESIEELLDGENAERLTYALGLCELLVPTMRHPNILCSIGKLLAITQEASQDYETLQGKHLQATPKPDKKAHRKLRRSRSRRSRSSQESMETETLPVPEQETKEQPKGDELGKDAERQGMDSNERDVFETNTNPKEGDSSEMPSTNLLGSKSTSVVQGPSGTVSHDSLCDRNFVAKTRDECPSKGTKSKNSRSAKLNNLIESLIDYCVRVVKHCRDLFTVLSALNECHVHEVQIFFRAVRSAEPKLMGDLQEKLLDTGSHNRLVTILSDMYT